MSGTQAEIDKGSLAATRIAADPAFCALDASGVPIVAASGDPLEVIYSNHAARSVFGCDENALAKRLFSSEQSGAKRLVELVESLRRGAALRLERLSLDFADAPQTVTVLCRRLADDEARPCFVIAALGLRPKGPDALLPTPEMAPRAAPNASAGSSAAALNDAALRENLLARHGARSPRFLWKTDAAGRFTDVTQTLADVVGVASADIVGRTVEEVAESFSFGHALAEAIASLKSFSGIEVDWPLPAQFARAPTTLGALPIMDSDRRFSGFQGFGVLHLSRAFLADRGTKEADRAKKAGGSAEATEPRAARPVQTNFRASNVVPLRPPANRQERECRAAPAPANDALTSAERMNFEEIARALRAGDLPLANAGDLPEELADGRPADCNVDDIAAALGRLMQAAPEASIAEPALQAPLPTAMVGILDCLPVGILVARGAQTLLANRTLLDYLGYDDVDAFEADGGLARMFFGRPPVGAGARAASVQSSHGETLDVDVHLQSIDWESGPATLVTLRRHRNPLPGPDERASGVAREREEKLARLQADNSLLRDILETNGVAVAVLAEDARIEVATSAFTTLFEAEPGSFGGLPAAALFSADEAKALPARLARASEAGETLRLTSRVGGKSFEARCRRLGPARKLCVILREPDAKVRDVELEAARDVAEQASAAKSDFLARISHEIRTPLNAIIGFAEVMIEERFGPIGSTRYKEYLRDVHASGAHVLSLVNDLLDLSKIEAGKMELDFDRVDANAVISECASIMQTQANQARVVMRLSLSPSLPMIRSDRRSLKQILLNLLSNAMKYNDAGGQVIVSTALTDAGYVVIRVKDTGIGMSDEEVRIALEPFKRIPTLQKRPGTGLGLPLTKALIEANHASFTIKSRKGEGTLIEVIFPPPQVLAAESGGAPLPGLGSRP